MKHAHRLKVKGCQRYFMQMNMKKNAGVTILIYDKIDFKTQAIVRDKEGNYRMVNGVIQLKDTIFVKISETNR